MWWFLCGCEANTAFSCEPNSTRSVVCVCVNWSRKWMCIFHLLLMTMMTDDECPTSSTSTHHQCLRLEKKTAAQKLNSFGFGFVFQFCHVAAAFVSLLPLHFCYFFSHSITHKFSNLINKWQTQMLADWLDCKRYKKLREKEIYKKKTVSAFCVARNE